MSAKGLTHRQRLWGVQWRSVSRLDGVQESLLFDECMPILFRTRSEAREWINRRFGYIRTRKDLRDEPHGWRIPRPIRVVVMPVE